MRLIDADKAVRDLQDFYHGCYSEVQLAPYQVDRWIEQQPTVMRWIPVEERMPEPCKHVIVSYFTVTKCFGTTHYVSEAAWNPIFGWNFNERPDWHVVAWMPLPEIYEKEEVR